MKDPEILDIGQVLANFKRFDSVLDARSPGEFALDHLPGAINTPVLDDEERARVGTLYKQGGAFEAKRVGAALVARNIARHLENEFRDHEHNWRPLVYCWRGGNRSGSLATILARIGWRVTVLEGGYKAFRRQVNSDLETLPPTLTFEVIAGRTGSAKSALLRQLAVQGAQVLDLEAIANHRGSVLGAIPASAQPSQKWFETQIWGVLREFDPNRPVYVESESKKVGQNHVPEALIQRMRASRCHIVQAPLEVRVGHLLDEYAFFPQQRDLLLGQLELLRQLHGQERLERWRSLIAADRWPELVEDLLTSHYDPSYDRSIRRNFVRYAQAQVVTLKGTAASDLAAAAGALLTECQPVLSESSTSSA